ncbi:hypothetical protein FF38_00557 [Lucilia cuprina]|uniref:Uncharacterized protein n=1 Tax=Lucilia cuprina TaxID=7375 RepID=A0A0L0CKV9_LUCCU|nr:hypothetical protein FF38_00557 [Lucilia cuprina]
MTEIPLIPNFGVKITAPNNCSISKERLCGECPPSHHSMSIIVNNQESPQTTSSHPIEEILTGPLHSSDVFVVLDPARSCEKSEDIIKPKHRSRQAVLMSQLLGQKHMTRYLNDFTPRFELILGQTSNNRVDLRTVYHRPFVFNEDSGGNFCTLAMTGPCASTLLEYSSYLISCQSSHVERQPYYYGSVDSATARDVTGGPKHDPSISRRHRSYSQ